MIILDLNEAEVEILVIEVENVIEIGVTEIIIIIEIENLINHLANVLRVVLAINIIDLHIEIDRAKDQIVMRDVQETKIKVQVRMTIITKSRPHPDHIIVVGIKK